MLLGAGIAIGKNTFMAAASMHLLQPIALMIYLFTFISIRLTVMIVLLLYIPFLMRYSFILSLVLVNAS